MKAAFPYTVPVMTGYLVLSAAYGVLMQSKAGYGPLWSTLTSALRFQRQHAVCRRHSFAGTFDPLAALIFSITINARYIFCSIGVLNRFAAAGPFKPFLYFALSDELCPRLDVGDARRARHRALLFCDVCTQLFLTGCLAHSSAGLSALSHHIQPAGLDFALTAMYVALFLDLLHDKVSRVSGVIGLVCTLLSLVIFGAGNVVIPAMLMIIAVLIAVRRKLE